MKTNYSNSLLEDTHALPKRERLGGGIAKKNSPCKIRDYDKKINPKDKSRVTASRIFKRKTNNSFKKNYLEDDYDFDYLLTAEEEEYINQNPDVIVVEALGVEDEENIEIVEE